MTKENVMKLLEKTQGELINILLDEARKVEKNRGAAERLAHEAFSDLRMHLEAGVH